MGMGVSGEDSGLSVFSVATSSSKGGRCVVLMLTPSLEANVFSEAICREDACGERVCLYVDGPLSGTVTPNS
jgi:hypothetical protein